VGDDGALSLDGVVLSADGQTRLSARGQSRIDDAANLGGEVAARLLEAGAADLVSGSRTGR
jgi:porphobilinogen deaminase